MHAANLSSIEVQIPTAQEQQQQIAPNERRQNAKVPPPVVEANAKRLVELIAHTVRAV